MSKDVTILEEIAEQELCQASGGTGFTFLAPGPVGNPVKTADMSPVATIYQFSS